jgi:hypothetical protein
VRSNLVRAVKQSRMAATVTFSRRQIRKTFSAGGQASVSKHSIILKLIRWFPTLERSQPFRRRIWDAEDYWTPMFDALSLAVTFLANHE